MAKIGSVGKSVFSNATAGLQGIFQDLSKSLFTPKGTRQLAGQAEDVGRIFSKDFSEAGKVLKSGRQQVDADLEDVAKVFNQGKVAADRTSGGEIAAELTKNRTNAAGLADVAGKYGVGDDLMGRVNSTEIAAANRATEWSNAIGAPFAMAKTALMDGSPLAVYAKGAAVVTAGQFMNGSRQSLTEQNGQKDIAGIPFI